MQAFTAFLRGTDSHHSTQPLLLGCAHVHPGISAHQHSYLPRLPSDFDFFQRLFSSTSSARIWGWFLFCLHIKLSSIPLFFENYSLAETRILLLQPSRSRPQTSGPHSLPNPAVNPGGDLPAGLFPSGPLYFYVLQCEGMVCVSKYP